MGRIRNAKERTSLPLQAAERAIMSRSAILHVLIMLTSIRRYKTAERVSTRLNEMSQDLTSMIEEINNVSATLSKTNKPDNPVSVRKQK